MLWVTGPAQSVVVNFSLACLSSQPPRPAGSARAHSLRAGWLGGHPQLTSDLLGHDRHVRPPHHVRGSLIVLGQDRHVRAALALRHQQYRTARDLLDNLRRRRFPFWFDVDLFSQPMSDPLGNGALLQLVAQLH